MVIFFNLLIFIVSFSVGIGIFYLVKFKSWKKLAILLIVWIAFVFGSMVLNPSYLPKGEVSRSSVPAFEKSDLEMQNRLLQPAMTEQERSEHFDKKFDALDKARSDDKN